MDEGAGECVQITDSKSVVNTPSGVRVVVWYHLPNVLADEIPLGRPLGGKHAKAVSVRPTQHETHSQADLQLHVPAAPAASDAADYRVISRQDTDSANQGQALSANTAKGLLPVHTCRRVAMRPTRPARVRVTLAVAREAWTFICRAEPRRGTFTPSTASAQS